MEDVLVPLIVFSFIALVIKMALDFSREKAQLKYGHREKAPAEGNSMGVSELRTVLRQAVEEANAPLREQLRALEARLEEMEAPRRLLPAAEEEPVVLEREERREAARRERPS